MKAKVVRKVPSSVAQAYADASEARARAYAPYSRFRVGAALLGEGGQTFVGSNIENASYGGAVCAERVAILKAVSSGVRDFSDIVVVTEGAKPAFPCALCLQMMAEFFAPETRIWVANTKSIRGVYKFKELLPHPFGPRELGMKVPAV